MPEIVPKETVPPEKKPLPNFRQDLILYPGAFDPDGSPTYNLYDPVRATYFKIHWKESLALKLHRPGMTLEELAGAIEANSTLKVDPKELIVFFEDASRNYLLDVKKTSDALYDEAQKRKSGWFMWLIMHYLYIRIPLFNPDKFLKRTLHYVLPLLSKQALILYAVLIVISFFQLMSRFDEFLHTFPYFFSISGAFFYAITITFVKIIHEFSHAYVAKYYKIYVPTIGIALIVFWPVLYTDVTDSWKLAKRPQRIAISAAGVIAELVLAAIAGIGWAWSSPGILQSAFFVIASSTWIRTLAINLNPAMRWDGYYLLSDLWGIDNLQPRAFAVTRWQLRKFFLGLNLEAPEEPLSTKRTLGMIIYSIYTWLYRIILYTTIAIFVYLNFTKALGILLFILEIGVFIVWPVGWELKELYKLRKLMTWNFRSILTTIALVIASIWFFVPLPHEESYAGITIPDKEKSQIVYVPYPSTIEKIYIKLEDQVHIGQPLVKLISRPLLAEMAATIVDKEVTQREVEIASMNNADRPVIAEKQAAISAFDEKIKGFKELLDELTIHANVDGTIYFLDETIREGQAVAKDQILAKITKLNEIDAVAYVPEAYIHDIKEGQETYFYLDGQHIKVPGKIVKIFPVRSEMLQYPALSSTHGGEIPTAQNPNPNPNPKQEEPRLVESYFVILIELDNRENNIRVGEKGSVHIRGPWKSKFVRILRYVQSILWREGSL